MRETIVTPIDGMNFEEIKGLTLTEFVEYMEKYYEMEYVENLKIIMEQEAPSRIDLLFRGRFDVMDE